MAAAVKSMDFVLEFLEGGRYDTLDDCCGLVFLFARASIVELKATSKHVEKIHSFRLRIAVKLVLGQSFRGLTRRIC